MGVTVQLRLDASEALASFEARVWLEDVTYADKAAEVICSQDVSLSDGCAAEIRLTPPPGLPAHRRYNVAASAVARSASGRLRRYRLNEAVPWGPGGEARVAITLEEEGDGDEL